jgi:hypothetical protein
MSPRARNVFVTGIPRSGTTLACALLDSLDNAVCLSEPDWQDAWPREMQRTAFAQRLRDDFARVRRVLQAGGEIPDRRLPDGAAITNYFPSAGDGSRAIAYVVQPLRRAGLDDDFLLGMKQNAHYTCIIEELVGHADFDVIAIVRHPLATIRSWRSAKNLPINDGRLPAAEPLWPELAALKTDTADVLLRQVLIYRMFCERYLALGERVRVVRYEDLVTNPDYFGEIYARPRVRRVDLQPVSAGAADDAETAQIQAYLRAHCPIAWQLYPELRAGAGCA